MEAQDSSGEQSSTSWRHALWPFLLVLLVLAVYTPSVNNGFVYDDAVLIVDPEPPESFGEVFGVFTERHWKGLPYYRPVPRSTMVAQKYLSGEDPGPYHLFNALLMVVAALAAYALLRRPVFGLARGLAFLGAALYALHPVASTTVHPIASGRETLIPAILVIAAVWAYLRSDAVGQLLALVFFALALLSKEQAIIVPLLFVLADLLRLTGRPPGRRAGAWVARYAPFVVIVGAYLAVRVALFGGTGEHRFVLHEDPLGPLRSLLYSLQSVFDPSTGLSYEPRFAAWFSIPHLVVVVVATAALVVWAARRWADVRQRVLFWAGWFVLAIAPTANVFHQEALFAERYAFLALLGVIGLVATLAGQSWNRPAFRTAGTVAGVVLIAASGWVSFSRGAYYKDELTFLEQWVRADPESAKAHHGLGQHYLAAEQFEGAFRHFELAVLLQPNYPAAHNNLGSMLALQGNPEQATHHFRQALQFDPKFSPAYNNLARALETSGQLDEAESLYLRSIEIDPSDASVYAALGQLYIRRSEPDKALSMLDASLRLDPDQARLHYTLGRLWLGRQDNDRAEFHFGRAVLIDPEFAQAHNNLGMLLARRNKMDLAKIHFESALKSNPDYVEAHLNYGSVLLYENDVEGGRRQFEEALRLDPDSEAARERLATLEAALESQGR